jgi:hypothetical protein
MRGIEERLLKGMKKKEHKEKKKRNKEEEGSCSRC